MKASELIDALRREIAEHGDLTVYGLTPGEEILKVTGVWFAKLRELLPPVTEIEHLMLDLDGKTE